MPKWLRVLLALCGAVLLVYGGVQVAKHARPKKKSALPSAPAKLEIIKSGATVVLEKTGDAWRMKQPVDAPADVEAVGALLKSLADLEMEQRLSQRPESHAQYEVTEASGIAVKVFEAGKADPAVSLIFGKMAPDFLHVYARRAASPDVYLALGPRRFDIDKPADQWRDRRIYVLAPDETVNSVKIEKKSGPLELVKSSDAWTLNGQPASANVASHTVSMFSPLMAGQFMDQAPAQDLGKLKLDKPAQKVFVSTTKNRTIEIHLGGQDPASHRFPARLAGSDVLFWIPSYVVDSLSQAAASTPAPAAHSHPH